MLQSGSFNFFLEFPGQKAQETELTTTELDENLHEKQEPENRTVLKREKMTLLVRYNRK